MKTLGIIGGIAPPSTIDYYRQLTTRYRPKSPDGGYPSLLIRSIDATRFLPLVTGGNRPALVDFLPTELGRLARGGADLVVPQADDRAYVNDRYFAELAEGSFRDETRTGISAVVDRMTAKDNIEAVILGGTELPLLFRDSGLPRVPILDTTAIHVESAIDRLLA